MTRHESPRTFIFSSAFPVHSYFSRFKVKVREARESLRSFGHSGGKRRQQGRQSRFIYLVCTGASTRSRYVRKQEARNRTRRRPALQRHVRAPVEATKLRRSCRDKGDAFIDAHAVRRRWKREEVTRCGEDADVGSELPSNKSSSVQQRKCANRSGMKASGGASRASSVADGGRLLPGGQHVLNYVMHAPPANGPAGKKGCCRRRAILAAISLSLSLVLWAM